MYLLTQESTSVLPQLYSGMDWNKVKGNLRNIQMQYDEQYVLIFHCKIMNQIENVIVFAP